VDLIRDGVGSFAAAEYSRDLAEELINTRIAKVDNYLKETASQLTSQGITVELAVREGAASENIAQYAEENGIDLIVMSTRGKGGIQRFLVGSVTDRVIRSGHLPVLAIPPKE
jgi:nucleotide-binding universal stress UspA family protein